ncbi:MAG: LysR family transcriptional regulator substrate-binding protein [Faecalibacterium sp.]|nr:LysR family transcriptional regulator substrate-binding protein [Faecalibacterium sp.]
MTRCSALWIGVSIHKEPVGLIVGKNHPFAHRSSVSVEDLRDERFIVYIRSFRGTNQMLYDLCSPYGFEPNIAMEAYNDYGVLNSVASGDGIAIIPTTRFLERPDVVRIPLDLKEPLMRDLTLVWRKNEKLPPAAAAFRDMLISTAQ